MSAPTNSPAPKNAMASILKLIRGFELLVVVALILLMVVVVALATIELVVVLWAQVRTEPFPMIGLSELLSLFGYFMMVLIGLELLETIKNYLTENSLHVEIVVLVAIIAVARKVIILDMKELEPMTLLGISCLLISLSLGYWLLKHAHTRPHISADGKDPPAAKEH
ncbi:MAG: phosphate-starvation-inducible PsiE family protein [Verrucomicrobia bacterium]|nr:phosphate-starvation-inducible PsiE family protein [Verrucomicrobiota bacterium]